MGRSKRALRGKQKRRLIRRERAAQRVVNQEIQAKNKQLNAEYKLLREQRKLGINAPNSPADPFPPQNKPIPRTKADYARYLKSKHWKRVRQAALDFYGCKCQECGSTGLLNVHHKTYERLWQEILEDVEVLCRSCHELEHLDKICF